MTKLEQIRKDFIEIYQKNIQRPGSAELLAWLDIKIPFYKTEFLSPPKIGGAMALAGER